MFLIYKTYIKTPITQLVPNFCQEKVLCLHSVKLFYRVIIIPIHRRLHSQECHPETAVVLKHSSNGECISSRQYLNTYMYLQSTIKCKCMLYSHINVWSEMKWWNLAALSKQSIQFLFSAIWFQPKYGN